MNIYWNNGAEESRSGPLEVGVLTADSESKLPARRGSGQAGPCSVIQLMGGNLFSVVGLQTGAPKCGPEKKVVKEAAPRTPPERGSQVQRLPREQSQRGGELGSAGWAGGSCEDFKRRRVHFVIRSH